MVKISHNTRWKDKNNLTCIVLIATKRNVLFKFEESEIECILSHKEFLIKFTRDISKDKQYCKSVKTDIYGGNVTVDKSVIVVNKIVKQLDELIEQSGLSVKEIAERLEWEESRLNMTLSGDIGLDIYSLTHIAGVLGYGFDVIFKKQDKEDING